MAQVEKLCKMVEKTPQISLDFEDSDTVKDDDTKFSKSGIDETQLKGLKIDIKDIDMFAFHQANMRINQYVAQMLNIPDEKLLHNIHRFGNTTAATIPLLLDEAARNGKIERGMKVATVAFGSGFTWGAAILDW